MKHINKSSSGHSKRSVRMLSQTHTETGNLELTKQNTLTEEMLIHNIETQGNRKSIPNDELG